MTNFASNGNPMKETSPTNQSFMYSPYQTQPTLNSNGVDINQSGLGYYSHPLPTSSMNNNSSPMPTPMNVLPSDPYESYQQPAEENSIDPSKPSTHSSEESNNSSSINLSHSEPTNQNDPNNTTSPFSNTFTFGMNPNDNKFHKKTEEYLHVSNVNKYKKKPAFLETFSIQPEISKYQNNSLNIEKYNTIFSNLNEEEEEAASPVRTLPPFSSNGLQLVHEQSNAEEYEQYNTVNDIVNTSAPPQKEETETYSVPSFPLPPSLFHSSTPPTPSLPSTPKKPATASSFTTPPTPSLPSTPKKPATASSFTTPPAPSSFQFKPSTTATSSFTTPSAPSSFQPKPLSEILESNESVIYSEVNDGHSTTEPSQYIFETPAKSPFQQKSHPLTSTSPISTPKTYTSTLSSIDYSTLNLTNIEKDMNQMEDQSSVTQESSATELSFSEPYFEELKV